MDIFRILTDEAPSVKIESMNSERTWQARAAKHAALADPARAQMIDLLTAGDRSPGELQDAVGAPSNLVAHHLNVMERAGLITRHRSEADRRRTYIALAPDAFADLLPEKRPTPRRVVFVCTANSARSQLAAALWPRFSSVPVASAGTHPAERVERGAIDTARLHGLELSGAVPHSLEGVRAPGDYVISVCDTVREAIPGGVDAHWSVPDPVRVGTNAAFQSAFEDIERRIAEFAPRLVPA